MTFQATFSINERENISQWLSSIISVPGRTVARSVAQERIKNIKFLEAQTTHNPGISAQASKY